MQRNQPHRLLFSQKAEILFLERARVHVDGDCVVYTQSVSVDEQRFNIPYRNTQILALGNGTSITNEAARRLASEGVALVFSGSNGMPHIMAGITEYHELKYAQGFIRKWLDENQRLSLAKSLTLRRLEFSERHLKDSSPVDEEDIERLKKKVQAAQGVDTLLGVEGCAIRNVFYKKYAQRYLKENFKRERDGDPSGPAGQVNTMLNHGNNLAYGLAAGALWHLGIPQSFPLIHGQTRNGGLIFDVADLIKDAVVLPWAFECHQQSTSEAMRELRYRIEKSGSVVFMMDVMKELSGAE